MNSNNDSLIEEKNNNINKIKNEIISINNKVEQNKNIILSLSEKVVNEQSIKNKIKKLEVLKHKIEANLSIIEKDIKFFNNNDDCPTCKQSIDITFKQNSIKTKETELVNIKDGLLKLTDEYNKLNDNIKDIIQHIEAFGL